MLRFILIVMIMIVLLRVGQDDPFIGFGLYLLLALSFIYITTNYIEKQIESGALEQIPDDEEEREKYYYVINSK